MFKTSYNRRDISLFCYLPKMWANWKISLHLIETLLTVFCTKKSISEILLKLYSFPDWFEGNQFKSVNEEKTQDNLLLFFGYKVVSDSLWPHGLQHGRLPCPSPSLSLLKIMSIESVMASNHLIVCCPFSSCLQCFPASGSLPMS